MALPALEAQESSNSEAKSPSSYGDLDREHTHLRRRYFVFVCLAVLLTTGITTTVFYSVSNKIDDAPALAVNIQSTLSEATECVKPVKEATDCGNSPHEARERGCRFDLMGFTWKPRECFDEELMEQFMQEKQWHWSLNPNGTELLSEGDIRTGVYEVGWTTWDYHLTHCLYMWMKLRRDVISNRPRDQSVMDLDHSLHCVEKLVTPRLDKNAWVTKFHITYPTCGGEEIDKNEGKFRLPEPGESEN